jgi:hypothetical protein
MIPIMEAQANVAVSHDDVQVAAKPRRRQFTALQRLRVSRSNMMREAFQRLAMAPLQPGRNALGSG